MALGLGGFILFFEGDKPQINIEGTSQYIGKNGTIKYRVTDGTSGIKSITVVGEQGDNRKILASSSHPRTSYTGAVGPLEEIETVSVDLIKEGFKDGPMTISIEAVDFSMRGWFKGNRSIIYKDLIVDTIPPRIQILHSEKYISPGGTGIAIYRLTDKDCHHGVILNGHFNPGFLVGDGRDDTYIAYFGLPYDAEQIGNLSISATDKSGNNTIVAFSTVYKKAVQKSDTINVSNGFLESKIPEFEQYYPEMTGEYIDKYLYANRAIRISNNEKISAICSSPDPQRYWKGSFFRMPGSSRAGFADHREYFFEGKAVDKQVHLGMDIASTRHAEVKAANAGKVIYTDYLGIYGNMVVVDHGQGIFSLYSHLSQISVSPGTIVDQKTVVGLTGTTGMAGGDHLHFSMLVNGVFVTPKEWWDQHWIEVTIDEPLTDSKF